MTLDYELDYGGRTQSLETLNQKENHHLLRNILDKHQVPMTAFVQTGILDKHTASKDVIKFLAQEFHSHSHTHASENFNSPYELKTSLELIQKHFKQDKIGYRAPFGKLYPGDHELLKDLGYTFDASLFPSYRPGKFNNLNQPITPHRLPCGLPELPFGVFPYLRLILGISYMKLLGPNFYKMTETIVGLPNILICYAHMHDFFPTSAIDSFPYGIKKAFSRNKYEGMNIADNFLENLKNQGYQFVTMNELLEKLVKDGL